MFNTTSLDKPILSVVSDQLYYTFIPMFSKTLNVYLQR